jgi:hypothetical protein
MMKISQLEGQLDSKQAEKDEITHRFEMELQTHKEEIINFQKQIEETKNSYDKIISSI